MPEIEPTKENIDAFLFTSSSLLTAVNDHRRLLVDVAWMPPDEPEGRFVLEVYHAPNAVTKKSKEEVNYYRDGYRVSTFETRELKDLVFYLEENVFAWSQDLSGVLKHVSCIGQKGT